MLWYHLDWLCNGLVVLMIIVMIFAFYAYYVDSKRPHDDPKKKNYHPLAIILAPITFPLFLILYISFFLLRVAIYGVLMALAILALILMPKASSPTWFDEMATKIGDKFLELNNLLVRFFLKPWSDQSGKT